MGTKLSEFRGLTQGKRGLFRRCLVQKVTKRPREEEEIQRRLFQKSQNKTKGWKAVSTLEGFSEVLSCGELKELLMSLHSHFSSYLARDLFPVVPGMIYIPFLFLTRNGLCAGPGVEPEHSWLSLEGPPAILR